MNRRRYYLMGCAVMLSILCLSFTSLNYPREQDQKSTLTVRLKVTDPKGHWANSFLAAGEVITMVDAKTNIGYSFTAVVQNRQEGLVEVVMSKITEEAGEITALGESVKASIKLGEAQQMGNPAYTVRVLEIVERAKEEGAASKAPTEAAITPKILGCCLYCDNVRLCGPCAVTADCGCCCPGCQTPLQE